MNVISLPENVGRKDPLSQGILPEVLDATIVCRFNDADEVERALVDHDVAAIILEPIPHNIGCVLPQPGFLERLRELATKHGTVLIFDEVITGFRHALGGYQSIAGVTPDLTTIGQGDGERLAGLGARRQGGADGAVLDDARPARVLRRHVQRPPADRGRGARDDRQASQREPVHEHVFALGERTRAGAARALRAARRAGRRQPASAPSSSRTSSRARSTSYDDLLANDVDLFVGYRRELMKHGIFELPLNLKRSHFSYAHTRRRRRPAARGDRDRGAYRARRPRA